VDNVDCGTATIEAATTTATRENMQESMTL
jgi:hypothetical protein